MKNKTEDEIYRDLMIRNSSTSVPEGWGRTQLKDKVIVTKPEPSGLEKETIENTESFQQPFRDMSKPFHPDDEFGPSVPISFGEDNDPDIINSEVQQYMDAGHHLGEYKDMSAEPYLNIEFLRENDLIPDWLRNPRTGDTVENLIFSDDGMWFDASDNSEILDPEMAREMNLKLKEIYELTNKNR